MNKEREIDGIRIVVNGEQYEAYKGTLQDQIVELQDRIDKAVEIIKKYGYEKQMEEDYLMNRVNLANYNCLLLDILEGDNK